MIDNAGFFTAVTVALAHTCVPVRQATLWIEPASMSACVIVCVDVTTVEAPGANGTRATRSNRPLLVIRNRERPGWVVFPVFVTTYVYVIT